MEWIHPEQFCRCVQRHKGNCRVHRFPCWDQFLAMFFAQLTYRDSLVDIEGCLRLRPAVKFISVKWLGIKLRAGVGISG